MKFRRKARGTKTIDVDVWIQMITSTSFELYNRHPAWAHLWRPQDEKLSCEDKEEYNYDGQRADIDESTTWEVRSKWGGNWPELVDCTWRAIQLSLASIIGYQSLIARELNLSLSAYRGDMMRSYKCSGYFCLPCRHSFIKSNNVCPVSNPRTVNYQKTQLGVGMSKM